MKKEAQTGADLGYAAKLVEGIPIALPTTSAAGGALARQPRGLLEVEATPPDGEGSSVNRMGANAKAGRLVASYVANLGKHRRAEPGAGVAPR